MYPEGVTSTEVSSDGVVTGVDIDLVPLVAGVALLIFSWQAVRRVMSKPLEPAPGAQQRRELTLAFLVLLALTGLALALSGVLAYS